MGKERVYLTNEFFVWGAVTRVEVTPGSHIKWSGPPELNIIFSLNTKTGSLIFKTIRELSVRLQIQQISDKTPTS